VLDSSTTERRRVWGAIAVTLLVISLPYLWAATMINQGMVYKGLLYNPDDQNVHLAWAKQASQGHFFFRDLFTTESLDNGERPLFNNIFCFVLGITGAVTHIPLIWLYQASRLFSTALALYVFYLLCCALTHDKRVRLVALWLAALSSGTGWLQNLYPALFKHYLFIDRPDQSFPMMPEAFTFTSAYIFPLFIASIGLLAVIYLWTLKAQQTGNLRYALGAGAAALILGNIHTYDGLPLTVTLLLWMLHSLLLRPAPNMNDPENATTDATSINKPQQASWLAPLLVILCALVPIAWQWIVFRGSHEFSAKALTKTPPPALFHILLSYGPLILLAALGAVITWREVRVRLMTLWAVVTLAFIYIPTSIFSFARKMIEGVHLPLCFLAACGLVWLVARIPSQLIQRAILIAVVAISCISSGQFIIWTLHNAEDNNTTRPGMLPPLYLMSGDAAALQFLAQQTDPAQPQVVLCMPYIGNYVPRETGMYAYNGHWAETLNQESKLDQVLRFYRGTMAEDEARTFLRANHIRYVFNGAYEKAIGGESSSALSQQLKLPQIYANEGAAIYKVH